MRLVKASALVCGVFVALPVAAQPAPAEGTPAAETKPAESSPPVVQMENTAASGSASPAAESAPAPAAAPAAPSAASGSPVGAPPPGTPGGPVANPSEWKFDFKGYLRAPLRFGLGKRDNPTAGQNSNTLHAPIVPDDQYLSWQYTSVQSKDWAEAFFSYGNSWVKGVIGLQAFNFTDAAFVQTSSQFGIAQGYVQINHDLGFENVRLEAKAGSFWGRYGMAGKYDSGKYDTFLFGRTHVMGAAVKMEIDVGPFTLWAEEGFGGKRPDPSVYNNAKFTLLNHVHGGIRWNKMIELGIHDLYSWTMEEDRVGATLVNPPDGSMNVVGPEVRVMGTLAGDLYFGFSHVGAKNAVTVAPAVEVIHSNGGGEYALGVTDNYLNGRSPTGAVPDESSNGNGAVDTVLLQYDFSLANLLANLKEPKSTYWGEGMDLSLSLFGMFNFVKSEDPDVNGITKMKFGTDLTFNALPWLAVAARIDRVQPNSRIPEQSFAILSPRVVFRSAWVTHEEITLQYSRYFYNQRTCAAGQNPVFCTQPPPSPVLPDGFGATDMNQAPNTRGAPTTRPDLNVFKVQATMWW
jgi:hypothetical protein